jgi:hypothetical protein
MDTPLQQTHHSQPQQNLNSGCQSPRTNEINLNSGCQSPRTNEINLNPGCQSPRTNEIKCHPDKGHRPLPGTHRKVGIARNIATSAAATCKRKRNVHVSPPVNEELHDIERRRNPPTHETTKMLEHIAKGRPFRIANRNCVFANYQLHGPYNWQTAISKPVPYGQLATTAYEAVYASMHPYDPTKKPHLSKINRCPRKRSQGARPRQ